MNATNYELSENPFIFMGFPQPIIRFCVERFFIERYTSSLQPDLPVPMYSFTAYSLSDQICSIYPSAHSQEIEDHLLVVFKEFVRNQFTKAAVEKRQQRRVAETEAEQPIVLWKLSIKEGKASDAFYDSSWYGQPSSMLVSARTQQKAREIASTVTVGWDNKEHREKWFDPELVDVKQVALTEETILSVETFDG